MVFFLSFFCDLSRFIGRDLGGGKCEGSLSKELEIFKENSKRRIFPVHSLNTRT